MTGKIRWILPVLICGIFFTACEDKPVEPPPDIVIEAVVTNASVFNGADGAIDVTLAGAPEPVAYFWSTGETSEDISGLYAGDYTLKVTYGMKGVSEATLSVGQPEPPELQLRFEVTDVSRFGKKDGSVVLSVSGGTPPYRAVWNGKDSTLVLAGIPAGTYQVVVTDNSSPTRIVADGSATISQPGFICGADSIADVNGNLYPTVLIGNQCWIAQNLRTRHVLVDTTLEAIDELFCAGTSCFGDRGAHYSWEAAMNGEAPAAEPYAMVQGICPEGFYLPTRKMFLDLDSVLSIDGNYGSGTFSGNKMKGGESSSGFDALYNGNWGYDVYINDDIAIWWTSTAYAPDPADSHYFMVTADSPFLSRGHKPVAYGLSVRCVKLVE